MNQLSGRDLWLCRQRKCQCDLFAPKQKYKETNTLFHHPSFTVWWDFYRRLCGNCCWNKPPQDRMLQRYPSAIYGPLYKRHITISACLQSRIYSGFHVHWLTARWCMRGMERKGWRGTHKCRRREEKKHKKIRVYLMLLLLCTTCGGKQWSKAFHHLILPEYKTLFSLQLGQNTEGRGGKEG